MRVFFITSESLKYHKGSHKGWNTLWQIQNVTQNLVQTENGRFCEQYFGTITCIYL